MEVRKRGRPKGAKGHRNDGLSKHCDCSRRRWPECSHPWFFAFTHKGVPYRFCLNKELEKPLNKPLPKTDAEAARDRFRGEIRAGTFRGGKIAEEAAQHRGLAARDVGVFYTDRYINAPSRRQGPRELMSYYLEGSFSAPIPARGGMTMLFGDKTMADLTRADVLAVRDYWRGRKKKRGTTCKDGLVGCNRVLRRLRHFFNWAIEEGYVESTPFRKNGRPVIRIDRTVETGRTRRLEENEEDSLLQHADSFMHGFIIAALDTGCRRGELLNLRWKQVRMKDGVLVLAGTDTKTYEARSIPLSQRVRAVLEMRRVGPDGQQLGPDTYVFGNEVGEQRKSVGDAWRAICEKANIKNLHVHDLRRECGSRLLEAGAGLHEVRDWLGHKDIATTSRYLAITGTSLQRTLKRLEEHRAAAEAAKNKTTKKAKRRASSSRPSRRMEEPNTTSVN